ncbi:MAG: hypothetical protein AAFZ01_09015 [Pseudomonadota bacterium]
MLLAATLSSPPEAIAQPLPTPTLNGPNAVPSANLAGTTTGSQNTGTLPGLGINQGVTFTMTGSMSGGGNWGSGLGFPTATLLQVQGRGTGLPNNFATYDIVFSAPVYGLQFTKDFLDFADDTIVTFFKGATQVTVAPSVIVATGANVTASVSGGTILAEGPGNNDGEEFFTVHLPLNQPVTRVVFSPTGKNNGNGGNVTLGFRDFAWARPSVAMTKSSSLDLGGNGTPDAGDEITYTYVVTNNGRTPLTNVVLTEPTFTGTNTAPSPTLSSATGGGTEALLPVGATLTYTANYPLSGTDRTRISVTNQARVSALPDGGTSGTDDVSDLSDSGNAGDGGAVASLDEDDPTITPIPQVPQLSLSKTADDDTARAAGETIVYTYRVRNVGNVIVDNIVVSDVHNGSNPAPVPAGEFLSDDVAPTSDSSDAGANSSWDTLAPGDEVTFVGSYTVTQTDVDTLQ